MVHVIEWTHNYGCPQDLADIETDDLLYVDVRSVTSEALMAEQERCQEMVDLAQDAHEDLAWTDRVVAIEDMRHLKAHSLSGGNRRTSSKHSRQN